MDTDRMSAAGFSWPASIATQIVPNVRLSELGALACLPQCAESGRVLLPVAFATPSAPPAFEIVLGSEANLKLVTYRIEGARTETRQVSRRLPANIPFILQLGPLSPGRWRVTIQAQTSTDKSTRTVESLLVS